MLLHAFLLLISRDVVVHLFFIFSECLPLSWCHSQFLFSLQFFLHNCLMHHDQSFNCLAVIIFLLYWLAGKTRARDAALNAIQSPLLDIGIERATGIVWNITGGTDLTLFEVGLLLWLSWLNLILLLFYLLHFLVVFLGVLGNINY